MPPSIKRYSFVVPFLMAGPPRMQFEPRWADATKCIAAAIRLKITNLSTVSAGLSAVNSPAEEIRRVRNFYAHRKGGTVQEALATNLFTSRMKPHAVFDLAAYKTGNVRVIESWITNLVLVATAASQ